MVRNVNYNIETVVELLSKTGVDGVISLADLLSANAPIILDKDENAKTIEYLRLKH